MNFTTIVGRGRIHMHPRLTPRVPALRKSLFHEE